MWKRFFHDVQEIFILKSLAASKSFHPFLLNVVSAGQEANWKSSKCEKYFAMVFKKYASAEVQLQVKVFTIPSEALSLLIRKPTGRIINVKYLLP